MTEFVLRGFFYGLRRGRFRSDDGRDLLAFLRFGFLFLHRYADFHRRTPDMSFCTIELVTGRIMP